MKRLRFVSWLMTLITVFAVCFSYAAPVSAKNIVLSDIGIKTDVEQYYDKEKNNYVMRFIFDRSWGEGYYAREAVCKSYLYDSSGKLVLQWTNKGKGNPLKVGKTTYRFNINASKYKKSEYTFKIVVTARYVDAVSKSHTVNFTGKYKINTYQMKPGIKFKQMTYHTRNDGLVVPRINVLCSNIKGQKLTFRIYDKYDNLIYQYTGNARKTNNETAWFTFSGYTEDGKYSDGQYKVKITASGGASISDTFNMKFPEIYG